MDNSLDVIDKSHKVENKNNFDFNISDPLTKLGCKSGDIILFNANLIHVGTINDIDDNLRIQMKVTHRDDRDILNYYEEIYM
jgi:ectoine hydroxylase-related dioxygenase (phytanoyl-CoA dioxygenase family)